MCDFELVSECSNRIRILRYLKRTKDSKWCSRRYMIHLKHIEHDFLYDQTWIFVIFICQNLWWISEETHPFGFILTHSKSKKSSHALTISAMRQTWTHIEMPAIYICLEQFDIVRWTQDWLEEQLAIIADRMQGVEDQKYFQSFVCSLEASFSSK